MKTPPDAKILWSANEWREEVRRTLTRRFSDPVAHLLADTGLSPNQVTLAGSLFSLGAGYAIARRHPVAGGVLFLASGAFRPAGRSPGEGNGKEIPIWGSPGLDFRPAVRGFRSVRPPGALLQPPLYPHDITRLCHAGGIGAGELYQGPSGGGWYKLHCGYPHQRGTNGNHGPGTATGPRTPCPLDRGPTILGNRRPTPATSTPGHSQKGLGLRSQGDCQVTSRCETAGIFMRIAPPRWD